MVTMSEFMKIMKASSMATRMLLKWFPMDISILY